MRSRSQPPRRSRVPRAWRRGSCRVPRLERSGPSRARRDTGSRSVDLDRVVRPLRYGALGLVAEPAKRIPQPLRLDHVLPPRRRRNRPRLFRWRRLRNWVLAVRFGFLLFHVPLHYTRGQPSALRALAELPKYGRFGMSAVG